MFKNILIATDGSAASSHAARVAVDLAHAQGAKLTAVYVVDPYPYLGIADTNPLGLNAYLATAQEHAAQAHAAIAQMCDALSPPVTLELRLVEHATVVKGILQTARAESCDLIVAGSHGRTGVEGALIGSVASKLVAQSEVPVLVVR